jgi:hypothetical protein
MEIQAVSEMDAAIEVGSLSRAEHHGRTPPGFIVYAILAGVAQVLWLVNAF